MCQCEECDYETVDMSNLKKHVKSVHQGIKYPCQQCVYKGSKENLKKHISAMHWTMSLLWFIFIEDIYCDALYKIIFNFSSIIEIILFFSI